MRSFSIPLDRLNLFLIALNMNFDCQKPDYIFQMKDCFEIVYTSKLPDATIVVKIEKFIADLWAARIK